MVLLLISLALPLQGNGATAAASTPALPPVTVRLSDSGFARGQHTRVYVRLRDTAYLLVLHVTGDGRIRVLFPLHPVEDVLVPGGRFYEIPGPDAPEAITVDEREGTGTVLAARSAVPFRFDLLARGDDWDYADALLFQPTAGNPLAAMLDIVERLAGSRRYDVDATTYTVIPTLVADDPAPDANDALSMGGSSGYSHAPYPGGAGAGAAYADSIAPAPSISAVCSNSYVAQGAVCGSVLINSTIDQSSSQTPSPPDYSQNDGRFFFFPFFLGLFRRRILLERPSIPAPPPRRPAETLPLPPRPSRVRVITPAAPSSMAPARPPMIVSRPMPEAWTRVRSRVPVAIPAVSGTALPVIRHPADWPPPTLATPAVGAPLSSSDHAGVIVSQMPLGVPMGARSFATGTPRPADVSTAATTRPVAQAFLRPMPIVPRRRP